MLACQLFSGQYFTCLDIRSQFRHTYILATELPSITTLYSFIISTMMCCMGRIYRERPGSVVMWNEPHAFSVNLTHINKRADLAISKNDSLELFKLLCNSDRMKFGRSNEGIRNCSVHVITCIKYMLPGYRRPADTSIRGHSTHRQSVKSNESFAIWLRLRLLLPSRWLSRAFASAKALFETM